MLSFLKSKTPQLPNTVNKTLYIPLISNHRYHSCYLNKSTSDTDAYKKFVIKPINCPFLQINQQKKILSHIISKRTMSTSIIEKEETQYKILDSYRIKDLSVSILQFKLPLDYDKPDGETITVSGMLVKKTTDKSEEPDIITYLQGGPGFECPPILATSMRTKELIERNFQVFYLDQRGTGLSTIIEASTLKKFKTVKEQAEYLLKFRADNIVRDCEEIRKALLVKAKDKRWSLLGQSFGGFCSVTYLSFFPKSLKNVLITGGIPPLLKHPDDVYHSTYARTKERNQRFYDKFPEDISRIKKILKYLATNKVTLPNGGILSVERFQQLGIEFGRQGGIDIIHQIVIRFVYDLDVYGVPSFYILNKITQQSSFDTNIIYAVLHEAIYCEGHMKSNWSADRLRKTEESLKCFNYDLKTNSAADGGEAVYLTGEMIFKSMFDDFTELRPFKEVAEYIAQNDLWSPLYDVNVLKKLTNRHYGANTEDQIVVPVVAATYAEDLFVDFNLTAEAAYKIGGIRRWITSEFFHGGLSVDAKRVLSALFALIESEVE